MKGIFKKRSLFDIIKVVLGIGVSIVILLVFIKDPLERFELITFDYRMRTLSEVPTHPDIVLIEMAEDSIDQIGRWPWPREWHATLVTALSEHKPKAIMFDVLFSEKAAELGDTALEAAVKNAGNVYLPFVFEFRDDKYVRNIIFPLDRFLMWTKGTGHVNVFPDIDGAIRRSPLIIASGKGEYPQLAFQLAGDYLGIKTNDLLTSIPKDEKNRMIIKWAGKWKETFRHYSYIDVVASYQDALAGEEPRIDLKEFEGKICLVGLTAAGLHDIRPNPIEPAYPALGVNANILNNILNNDFIKTSSRSIDIAIILVLGLLMSLAISRLRPVRGIIASFLILAGYIAAAFILFRFMGLWINIVYPVILIVASYSVITLYSQVTIAVERSKLFNLATRDGVTGLYVLRHFHLLLEAEMEIANKDSERSRLSLIMGDIDFFKRINDGYGHQGGDAILSDISKIIRSNLRELDIACRYGGEEFIIMLPEATLEDARKIAERIRKGVDHHHTKYGNEHLNVKISFGVAAFNGEKNKDEFIKKADDALYRAKKTGRNKVSI